MSLRNDTCYIGSSKNIIKRFTSHLSTLRLNKHTVKAMQRDFNLYGEHSFMLTILEECGKNNFYEREGHWIKEMRLRKKVYNRNESWDVPLKERVHLYLFISKDDYRKLQANNNGAYYKTSDYVRSLIYKDILK